IRFVTKPFRREALAGFFRLARVGLVTPLRDGMNLVAKEYVAAQDPENPGVLVLSRFAGAASELQDALVVNPFDMDQIADELGRALAMPLAERRLRWERMMYALRRNPLETWSARYLEQLRRPAAPAEKRRAGTAGAEEHRLRLKPLRRGGPRIGRLGPGRFGRGPRD